MNFARKIINSNLLKNIIRLPENLKNQKVEILVLPVSKTEHANRNNFNPDDYIGLLKIDNIDDEIKSIRDEWDRF